MVPGSRQPVLRKLALSRSPHTLLIVDDNPDCRLVLTTFLTAHGYQCLEAADGVAALALLQEHAVDLIILDYHMPSMNGCEFLEEVGCRVDDPPPAVMITGTVLSKMRKRAMDAGAKAILSKPYERTTILSIVREHLQPGAA